MIRNYKTIIERDKKMEILLSVGYIVYQTVLAIM